VGRQENEVKEEREKIEFFERKAHSAVMRNGSVFS
jgi:hypothetical protein